MYTNKDTADAEIAKLGEPILRNKAKVVQNILGDECQSLIRKLMSTVESAGGMGIAAPQIHHSQRVFIMCSKPNERYPNAPLMSPTVFINPEILSYEGKTEKGWEGCLSVPGLRGLVPRHSEILVSYYDEKGQPQQTKFKGFLARIFQHELDHLNGIIFIDRLACTTDLVSEDFWYQSVLQNEQKTIKLNK